MFFRSGLKSNVFLPLCIPLTICVFALYIFNSKAEKSFISSLKFCLSALFVVILLFVSADIANKYGNKTIIRNAISRYGAFAVPAFIVFQILQVVILPVPGLVSIGAGVCLFGSFLGGLYSFIGISVGSFIAFFIGRKAGRRAVVFLCGDMCDRLFVRLKNRERFLAAMFILPFFPDDLLCFVAGMSSMRFDYFAPIMIFSRLISSFIAAYFIDGVPFNTPLGITFWCATVVVLIAAAVLIEKKLYKKGG